MADKISKEQRSKNMSAIRSSGNKSTEAAFIIWLKENRVTGWRRNYKLPGKPDFVFPTLKLIVFIDGCFWHGCRKHSRIPKSNIEYWDNKITRNIQRDKEINRIYKSTNWKLIRIWEHSIKSKSSLKRIKSIIENSKVTKEKVQ
jgi:DNA mismatch endonuclease (patch repair protein)